MAYARIMVPLTADDRTKLFKRAEEECRDPREHLRYLLRQDAEHRGPVEFKQKNQAASADKATRNDPTDHRQV